MKKFIIALFFFIISSSIYAATVPQNVSLKINFNYHKQQAAENANNYQIENNLKLDTSNHRWNSVENSKKNKSNIILLSRITDATTSNITLEFLVLDTTKSPAVISQPKIIAVYGQKNEIVILNDKDILGLTVFPTA
jgi:uncharacterized protein (DUF2225 family)